MAEITNPTMTITTITGVGADKCVVAYTFTLACNVAEAGLAKCFEVKFKMWEDEIFSDTSIKLPAGAGSALKVCCADPDPVVKGSFEIPCKNLNKDIWEEELYMEFSLIESGTVVQTVATPVVSGDY